MGQFFCSWFGIKGSIYSFLKVAAPLASDATPLDLPFHGGFRSWALPLGKTYVPLQPGSNQRIIVLCLLITCMQIGANKNSRQILCQAHIIQKLHTTVWCLNNESLQWRGIAALICSDKNITSAQPLCSDELEMRQETCKNIQHQWENKLEMLH